MKKIDSSPLRSARFNTPGRFGIFVGVVAVAGIVLVVRLFAASGPIGFEAELGTRAGGATTVSDSAASGGSAVKFGSPTPTPTPDTASVFTLASLPDTQRDLWNTTSIANNFNGRFNYLVANKTALNLKYVWQVGDLEDTDNLIFSSNTAVNPRYINSPTFNVDHFQYIQASNGLKILENAHIPYALTVGNHDTGAVCGGPACPLVAGQTQTIPVEVRNTTSFNTYEPPSRQGLSTSQGTNATDTSGTFEAGKSDNAYRTFSAGGIEFLLINMELWPRTAVVAWDNAVVASHPHDNVIIITHSYLTGGGTIDSTNGGYGTNTMQYVFDNFVKLHSNIRFVFSGHVGNSDYRVDTGVNGNKIYDMMDTYHDTVNNWIRLLTFDTANNTVKSKVYAPLTNQTRSEAAANVNITGIDWVR